MVYLGFMLPTDEKHEEMLKQICKELETSEETIMNGLIEQEHRRHFGV